LALTADWTKTTTYTPYIWAAKESLHLGGFYDITTLGAGKFMKVNLFGRDLRLWLATPHKAVKA
jgi:hypothetical protein